MEESIRYLNLLKSPKRNASINLNNGINLCEKKKCKTETLSSAFEYLELYWSAYSRMREDYGLPSITTLNRLTFKVKTAGGF